MKRLFTTPAVALVLSLATFAPANAGDGLGIGLGILGGAIAGSIIQQQQGAAADASHGGTLQESTDVGRAPPEYQGGGASAFWGHPTLPYIALQTAPDVRTPLGLPS